MNLEHQCVSLNLSKKLKELNIKQKSFFHWYVSQRSNYSFILESKTCNYVVDSQDEYDVYSAFTASELMQIIPARISLPDCHAPFNHFRFDLTRSCVVEGNDIHETFIVNYVCDTSCPDGKRLLLADTLFTHNIWDKNLCNALAKMLLYMIENKLVDKATLIKENATL